MAESNASVSVLEERKHQREVDTKSRQVSAQEVGLLKKKWVFVNANGEPSTIPSVDRRGRITFTPLYHSKKETVVNPEFLEGLNLKEAECMQIKLNAMSSIVASVAIASSNPNLNLDSFLATLVHSYSSGLSYTLGEGEFAYMQKHLESQLKKNPEFYNSNKELFDKFFDVLAQTISIKREANPHVCEFFQEAANSCFELKKEALYSELSAPKKQKQIGDNQ